MNDTLLTAIADARAAGETRGRIPLPADYAVQPGWNWAALWDATEALNISIGVLPAPDFGPTPVLDWTWSEKKGRKVTSEEILTVDMEAMTPDQLESHRLALLGVAYAQDERDTGAWATDAQQERARQLVSELDALKERKGFKFSYEVNSVGFPFGRRK